ncbi:hypothetical protein DRO59_00620 [Candidatus Bathyarchaeota archaeon]|nr:MAG: hypothetical protein DRO59_00620 [Candidatus Bathyarchaeota archaeon]
MRLALDLDRVSQLKLLKVYSWLAQFTDKLELFITSVDEDGGEHYHIVAHNLPELPENLFYEFRRALHDDIIRVWLDETLHGKPEQVLFARRVPMDTRKPRTRWRLYSILWKPFWSRLPTRKHYKPRKFLLSRDKIEKTV